MSDYQQYVGGEAAVYEEGNEWQGEPIPVVGMSERRTPELVGCMTWQIPTMGVGQPVQLLQRTVHRFKAKITINTMSSNIVQATGSAAAGGNGTATLPIGASISSFLIAWGNVATANTVTVTVANTITGANITYQQALSIGANSPMQVNYSPVLGPATPASAITVTVTGNVNSPTANIVANGTSASTPSIVFSQTIDRVQGSSPQGMTFTPTTMPYNLPDWESQQPLYAICTTGTATVSVQDERFLEKL